MVYKAKELLARLRHLTLVGQNEGKELEWVGSDKQWNRVKDEIKLSELIFKDF